MNFSVGNISRAIIYTHTRFDKRFTHKDVVQLLPPNKSWPQPEYEMGDFPLILEFNTDYLRRYTTKTKRIQYESVTDERPEEFKESFRKLDYQRELVMLLTLCTTFKFYQKKHDWVMTRKKLGKLYFRENFRRSTIQHVELKPSAAMYNNIPTLGQPLEFPDVTHLLLDKYLSLAPEPLDVFRKSMILFYNSFEIGNISYSLSFISLISAIENMVTFETQGRSYKQCYECNRPLYALTRRFRDFLSKYGNSSREFKKYANELYNKRSKIAHAGQLLLNDYDTVESDYEPSIGLMRNRSVIRLCLVNWLMRNR